MNNNNDDLIRVLWVEDDPEVTKQYPITAERYGLDLVAFPCWDDAFEALKYEFDTWGAIILDAKCKHHKDNQRHNSSQQQIDTRKRSLSGLITTESVLPFIPTLETEICHRKQTYHQQEDVEQIPTAADESDGQAYCSCRHEDTQMTDVIVCPDCCLLASPHMKTGVAYAEQCCYNKDACRGRAQCIKCIDESDSQDCQRQE